MMGEQEYKYALEKINKLEVELLHIKDKWNHWHKALLDYSKSMTNCVNVNISLNHRVKLIENKLKAIEEKQHD